MIRLGVVGFGRRMSEFINIEMRKVESDLRIVGVIDPDEDGVRSRLLKKDKEEVVFYPSLKTMVSKANLNGLLIGTRCDLHTPYAIEAAKYDIPLFLEKPVAISMEQAISLEKAFEKSRCQVVVSFPLRLSHLCALARQYVTDGAVGKPEHILAVNYVPYGTSYFEIWHRDFQVTQGLFLQKATHDFDYMCYLMNANIVRIAAMASWGRVFGGDKPAGLRCSLCNETDTCLESPGNRRRNYATDYQYKPLEDHPCLFSKDIGSPESGMNEDSSSALVEFANGAKGIYTQVFYARRDVAARGAIVSGYLGTVSFDWYQNELKRIHHHPPFVDTIRGGENVAHFGGDRELAYDFIGLIKGKTAPRNSIQAGIQSVYTCLAAREYAEKGTFVKVRQVGEM